MEEKIKSVSVELARLQLTPGEVLVVTPRESMSRQETDDLLRLLRNLLPSNTCVILKPGTVLTAVKAADLPPELPREEERVYLERNCSVCGLPLYITPSGLCCAQGHGFGEVDG